MEWLVIWLIFGLVAGAISNGRGQGFGSGLLWGVLLGPIGILIALLYTPSPAASEQRQLASGTVRKCPYCAEIIKAEAIVCRYCGRDVPATSLHDSLVEYGLEFVKQYPQPHHMETLRRDWLRDGHDPIIVDQALAAVEAARAPWPPRP